MSDEVKSGSKNGRTVNSQCRDTQEGAIDLNELRGKPSVLVCKYDTPSKGQVTVKPRMPDAAAVSLDTNLKVAELRLLRHWPDLIEVEHRKLARCANNVTYPQVGAVDMGGDYRDTSSRLPLLWKSKGKKRTLVPGSHWANGFRGLAIPMYSLSKVVFSPRLKHAIPVISISELNADRQYLTCQRKRYYRTFRNPACSSLVAAVRTAWKGVGDALTKLMSLVAASGPACGIIIVWTSW